MLTEYHLCRNFCPSMKSRNPYCTEILIAFIGCLDNEWFFQGAGQRLVGLLLLFQFFRIYLSALSQHLQHTVHPSSYMHICFWKETMEYWQGHVCLIGINPHWGWLKRGLCPTNVVRSLWPFNVMEGHHLSFTSDLLKWSFTPIPHPLPPAFLQSLRKSGRSWAVIYISWN